MKQQHIDHILKTFPHAEENKPLSELTYIKLGGPARIYLELKSREQVQKFMEYALQEELNFFILGKGCNVIFKDKGYNGVVIRILLGKIECIDEGKLYAEAGVTLLDAVFAGHRCGFTGMEDLSGIPSSIGGAIFGNAGAGKAEMGDFVESIDVFEFDKKSKTTETKTLSHEELEFEYRESALKKKRNTIILSAVLHLNQGDPVPAKDGIEEKMESRSKAQPLMYPSAGCVFKNPPGESAGRLIQLAGLNGTRRGGMMISEKHGNFIVNNDKGTYAEYLELMDLAKAEVKKQFGIELEAEHIVVESPE